MKSILLADDDALFCSSFQKLLKRFGYQVETVGCIDDAYHRAENTAFSLILVELNLGKEHGIILVRQLRALGIASPIAMFTMHDSELYETASLDAGADDYILKGMSIGRLVLDRQARVLEADDRVIKLTEKETAILDLLSRNPRRIFPIPEILEKVWGRDFRKSEDALHAVLKRLRKKLEQECGVTGLVENYHGRGFRLAEQIVSQTV
jgi:DNA-binding response OmpR family regulator